MRLARYTARRLAFLVISLLGLSIVLFAIVNILPGDVAVMILGVEANQEKLAALRQQLGLNRPIWIRYLDWLTGVLTGDLGNSLRFGDPVTKLIVERFPPSAFLAVSAMVVSIIVAIPLGVVAAINQNKWEDFLASIAAFSGISLPNFFWGLVLIILFAEYLDIFPPSGYVNPLAHPIEGIAHVILPALALGFGLMAYTTRMTRSSLVEELRSGYIQLARSKGLRERTIVYRHALRNAFLPVLTVIGFQFGYLFGGIVVIETLFVYPGMGRLAFQALLKRDVPLILGSVLVIATVFMISNLIVDLLYAVLDPRIGDGRE